jgi:hypothetical protein
VQGKKLRATVSDDATVFAVGTSVAVGGVGYLGGLVESSLEPWAAVLLVIAAWFRACISRARRRTGSS